MHALRSYLPCPRRLRLAQQPIAGLVTHVVFAGPVHVVHIDLVAGQDGHGANELPARVEHEQPRPLWLPHVLEALSPNLALKPSVMIPKPSVPLEK